MALSFFEVFPDFAAPPELSEFVRTAEVERVAANKFHTAVRVYLTGHLLLPKRRIWQLENALREQIFAEGDVSVSVIERYDLGSIYSPETVYEQYADSMEEELDRTSPILHSLSRSWKLSFTEDAICVTLPDNSAIRFYEDQLVEYLYRVFGRRFGFSHPVEVDYIRREKSRDLEVMEERLKSRVASIGENYETAKRIAAEQKEEGANSKPAVAAAERSRNASVTQKSTSGSAGGAGKGFGKDRGNSFGKDRGERSYQNRQPDPNRIYGRSFFDEPVPIIDIGDASGVFTIMGRIFATEERKIRGERVILTLSVTDETDSIPMKLFLPEEDMEELRKHLSEGNWICAKGTTAIDAYDHELCMSSVVGIKKTNAPKDGRKDEAPHKRVELHCHTKMSDMDGVSDVKDIIKTAKAWGHKAIAITDHGVVQAFPDAYHAVAKDPDFKVIYGCEIYLVDDTQKITENEAGQNTDGPFVVFDIETTGFSSVHDAIIEIGAVRVEKGAITDRFSTFINPRRPIPYKITKLTSITDGDVADADGIEAVLPRFLDFCKDAVLVAHNARFDTGFISENARRLGLTAPETFMDTVAMARHLEPALHNYKLDTVAKAAGVSLEHHHRAVDDAECTAGIFLHFMERYAQMGCDTLAKINEVGAPSAQSVAKMHPYHCILLAANDIGRINLYRLVSLSHVKYFSRFPKVPKSELRKHREGLIVGSACEAGEVFRAVLDDRGPQELHRIVEDYDYLEIQPTGNNAFLLREEDNDFHTVEDLQNLNRRIVELADEVHKPCVATCDVHFLHPKDEIYRRILMAGKGFKDADEQPPLYLHTTDEMLDEFSYLGAGKAREVVVDNPNKIADMCERIAPVRPDKCPPVIPDSDKMLRKICYTKAHEWYGEDLPPIVSERLERELNSIIGNGYAVMYIIAQKLVWKSNEDGYLVGSRGSVGSSFVATMAGITEVNPLRPHYRCPNCRYSDFDSPEVLAFGGRSGCDMPDKNCPVCGKPLFKDGFDIPFETFLGFKGNKEPDIDLNFSGDYQGKAHRYTEVIFGEGQTYRAGTIGTLAEKTAYGFIKKYFEERGENKRSCEINRIVGGCVGVRRTTGQHPGGIIVLPVGEEMDTFTPIQHPANDMTTDIVTTHFDYHSIDSNLLKLDILGHDDPTMIRMLEELTGLQAATFPLDDKKVMSLFMNTEALGVTPEDLWEKCPLGTLGVPEFGTDFAMGMLIDAAPKEFSDLVRIAGLAHGTDVWLGNAQDLIAQGKATIATAICTRDDIMIYLISKGMDPEQSFTIMESVRKGKGLKPEWEEEMIAHDVPDWYIWSCKKIKYMFPKAHAAAYVMMAWRIAWCKVYRPLEYYASFFTIRATAFSYELMCLGRDVLERYLADYLSRKDTLSKKEQDTYRDMRIVQEFYARGFEFEPMDLYRSGAQRFSIADGKLLPPFSSIEGMGQKAAESLYQAAHEAPFISKLDLRERGKVSKTIVDKMSEMGILKGLPENNQLSLFDAM